MNSVVLNAGLVSSVRRAAPMRGSRAMGRPASTAMVGPSWLLDRGRQAFPAWWAGQKRRVRTRTWGCKPACEGRTALRIGQTVKPMPRSIWTGAISFGLVTVPVKLYSAVSKKTVRFHQLDSEGGVRISQKRVNPVTGEEVPWDRLVKGYEIAPEKYVLIDPDELEALEPEKTRTIDIED